MPTARSGNFCARVRLSPVDPGIGYTLCGLAAASLIKGEHEKALEYARCSARELPRWISALRTLAVAAVKAGRQQEAQDMVRRISLHSPDHSIATERRVLPYRDEWVREMLWMGSALQGSQNDRAPPRTYSRRRCPSLALFGHPETARRCPLTGGKADIRPQGRDFCF
jgi:hypothetical protein